MTAAVPMRAPSAALSAAVGGTLLTLAFPPVGVRPLALVGPALLLVAVHRQRLRRAGWLGLLFGMAFYGPLLVWMQFAGAAPWIALTLLETALVAVSAVGLALVSRLPGWPIWSAAVWVLGEAVRARVPFGGFTWGRLAFSQDEGPLTKWVSVLGAPGLSLVAALAAAMLAAGVLAFAPRSQMYAVRSRAGSLGYLAVALGIAVSGILLPGPPEESGRSVVALVQGNVPRLGLDFNAQRQRVVRNHVDASLELAARIRAGDLPRPDLVIWPENATDIDPTRDAEIGALLTQAAQAVEQPILVGAVLDAPKDRALNAGIVWDPVTGPGARYVKRHLVPYGEYVPFRRQLQPVFGQLALIPRDFATGDSPGVIELNGVTLGDVICFEVSYDGLVRDVVTGGGELIVVQTNNASFERSGQTQQQLAMSRLRAVEHGRTVLVAATSGISAIIAPDGSFTDRSEIFTRDLLVAEVARMTSRTTATRLGDLPESLVCLVAVSALLAAARAARTDRSDVAARGIAA
ncbi:MAG TPA: apolipoprotein N-acyltransferase [Mycobacteriales bacterium]|nr:apolipoprotein N-acyltransferase [Mycobacteriales bacterium]